MVGAKLALIGAVVATVSTPAVCQILKDCKGDYPRPITDGQYKFLLTTRTENFTDHVIGYTCVANLVEGYFRLRWHIPSHYAEFIHAEANELPRPLNIGDTISPLPGCYSYGNLAKSDRATFYADESEAKRVKQEFEGACPQSLASNDLVQPPVPSAEPKPKMVPKKVRYSYDAAFFIDGPEKEKDVTRISFFVTFVGAGTRANLLLNFQAASSPDEPDFVKRGLTLRPIPPAGDDPAARAFVEVFNKKFDNRYQLTKTADSMVFAFERQGEARFGSARLGVYSDRILSVLWVPVLY